MKSFVFKSAYFELTLEDCENEIEIFQKVLQGLSEHNLPSPPVDTAAIATPSEVNVIENSSHVDIDEYFAEKKPTKLREILEGTITFLVEHRGQVEFSKLEVFDLAKSSLYYDVDWTKNRTSTFDRLIKDGFIAKRPEGKFKKK